PTGAAYSRNFGGDNWADMRRKASAYDDRDPVVLVIGGAQSGLSIAARLNQVGVDTLVVEKWPRIGDSWRKRYHSLALHNSIHLNHLPYMEFPPTWPKYIPGHAGELVRVLCRRHGDQLLDRHGIRF